MTETSRLYGPVAEDIPLVGERLRQMTGGRQPLLADALTYVFRTSGK
jgi:hypothetical protein